MQLFAWAFPGPTHNIFYSFVTQLLLVLAMHMFVHAESFMSFASCSCTVISWHKMNMCYIANGFFLYLVVLHAIIS